MIEAHYSGEATDSRFSILRHFTSVRAAGIFHCRLNDAATWTAEKRGNCTPVEIGQSIMRREHDECIGKKSCLPPAAPASSPTPQIQKWTNGQQQMKCSKCEQAHKRRAPPHAPLGSL